MDELLLSAPDEQNSEAIWVYREEFLQAGESLDGTAGLAQAERVDAWLARLRRNGSEATVEAGLVPASTFLCLRKTDGRLVGMIDIRHRLNGQLLLLGGHIGYSVRRGERRKGYATRMLGLGLVECRRLGIDRVLVTCEQANIASARVIMANGGVLESEVEQQGRVTQRYWIEL